jgi:hypothetical protein
MSPSGQQLSVLVKLDCTVRQGFFSWNQILGLEKPQGYLFAKMLGRLLGSLLNLLQAHLNQYFMGQLVPKKGTCLGQPEVFSSIL